MCSQFFFFYSCYFFSGLMDGSTVHRNSRFALQCKQICPTLTTLILPAMCIIRKLVCFFLGKSFRAVSFVIGNKFWAYLYQNTSAVGVWVMIRSGLNRWFIANLFLFSFLVFSPLFPSSSPAFYFLYTSDNAFLCLFLVLQKNVSQKFKITQYPPITLQKKR